MVHAIAAASQREAKAHETAIMLSKENEELRMKLKHFTALLQQNKEVHLTQDMHLLEDQFDFWIQCAS